jgi:uncharacterized membrane protein
MASSDDDKADVGVRRKRTLGVYSLGLVLAGLGVSLYLSFAHITKEPMSFCEMGEHVSCDRVLHSEYAILFQTPLAFFGVFFFMIAIAFTLFLAGARLDDREVAAGFFVLSLVGVASVIYFVYAELMVGAVCLLCTVVHLICLALVPLAWKILNLRHPTWRLTPSAIVRLASDLKVWLLLSILLVATPVLLINILAPPGPPQYSSDTLVALGKCLAKKRVILFTKGDCSYCVAQKKLLGDALEHFKTIECNGQPECVSIGTFPTWLMKTNSVYQRDATVKGVQSVLSISQFSGCEI